MPGGRWPDPRSNRSGLTVRCNNLLRRRTNAGYRIYNWLSIRRKNLEMLTHDSQSDWANRRGKWLISYALVSIYANLSCSTLQEEFVPRDELPYYQSLDASALCKFLSFPLSTHRSSMQNIANKIAIARMQELAPAINNPLESTRTIVPGDSPPSFGVSTLNRKQSHAWR